MRGAAWLMVALLWAGTAMAANPYVSPAYDQVQLPSPLDANGNFVLGAAGSYLQFYAGTKVLSPVDGTLQVTNSAGSGTVGSFLFGTTASNAGMRFDSDGGHLRLSNGSSPVGTGDGYFIAGLVNGGQQIGSGLVAIGGGGGVSVRMGNAGFPAPYSSLPDTYLTNWNLSGPGFIHAAPPVVAKTANYTLTATYDHGAHFTNAGATGAITFTLPTAQAGLQYDFTVIANFSITVTAPAGTLTAPGLTTGSSRSMATQYGSFQVVCYDGTNWVVRNISGTVN